MNEFSTDRVLVLDGHLRHSIALIRSLGQRGLKVVAATDRGLFPARVSRHCWKAAHLAADGDFETRGHRLIELIERYRTGVVIPAALAGNELICRCRSMLEPRVRAPYNDPTAFDQLAHKDQTVALAEKLGVPVPRSMSVSGEDAVDRIAATFTFPLVFKSIVDQGTVRYARDASLLRTLVRDFWRDNPDLIAAGLLPIVQEYIRGDGHGFYGLARDGTVLVYFMHKRLHEVPPSGGPSAMATSFDDPVLKDLGERFFVATRWTGPAMVEFKKSRADGRYYLIEVNPKFWGSLELGIAAGVDFPYHTWEMLTTGTVSAEPGRYARDFVFRWLTMDLAHSVQARRLGQYLKDFGDRSIHDDFHMDDPLPSLVLFAQGVSRFLK